MGPFLKSCTNPVVSRTAFQLIAYLRHAGLCRRKLMQYTAQTAQQLISSTCTWGAIFESFEHRWKTNIIMTLAT